MAKKSQLKLGNPTTNNVDRLNNALRTGDDHDIAQTIGRIARARGMSDIARQAGVSRENLYRSLVKRGKPEFSTIMKVLDALDVQLVAKLKGKKSV